MGKKVFRLALTLESYEVSERDPECGEVWGLFTLDEETIMEAESEEEIRELFDLFKGVLKIGQFG